MVWFRSIKNLKLDRTVSIIGPVWSIRRYSEELGTLRDKS